VSAAGIVVLLARARKSRVNWQIVLTLGTLFFNATNATLQVINFSINHPGAEPPYATTNPGVGCDHEHSSYWIRPPASIQGVTLPNNNTGQYLATECNRGLEFHQMVASRGLNAAYFQGAPVPQLPLLNRPAPWALPGHFPSDYSVRVTIDLGPSHQSPAVCAGVLTRTHQGPPHHLNAYAFRICSDGSYGIRLLDQGGRGDSDLISGVIAHSELPSNNKYILTARSSGSEQSLSITANSVTVVPSSTRYDDATFPDTLVIALWKDSNVGTVYFSDFSYTPKP
jgi:hypothetical protein